MAMCVQKSLGTSWTFRGCPQGKQSPQCLTALTWSHHTQAHSRLFHLISEHPLSIGILVQQVSLVFPNLAVLSFSFFLQSG